MYHFYFNLPKNDKNPGTVYLPHKKSTGLPVVISCYGWNVSHWPKRVEEAARDLLVNKHGLGFVTMALHGQSDDTGACGRWEENLADMVAWVKAKNFADVNKVGLFAFGAPANAAWQLTQKGGAAFSIITVNHENNKAGFVDDGLKAAPVPVLFLQGTTDKVQLFPDSDQAEELIKQHNPETGSSGIVFKGSDYFLYNVAKQAAVETAKWLKGLEIVN
jgi:alpha/beta superfamily hydrolase